ncbi:MAG: ferrochelatase [Candidatus Acidiferrales bacterium]|jgi:ferrochelatase
MAGKKKVGVVLFQLGGPDSREAVEPFLYNLFCDPDIIPLGPLGAILRRPLARYISTRRSKVAGEHYDAIGGSSPIRQLTERQRDGLGESLAPFVDPAVVIAMRYWHPLTEEAVEELRRRGPVDEIVLLPLYPHYSYATTKSSLKEWDRVYGTRNGGPPVRRVEQFYDHPLYIEALVDRIRAALREFDDPAAVHLIFSAHGLPMSLVENGDPYPRQIEETVRLVCAKGAAGPGTAWPRQHTICYQSRVGRQKWLEPSLTATIERLARGGARNMLVVPISFVTEHIETLHEINIEAREEAEKLGVTAFRMMPALGDSPLFISALADLVLRAIG